jgi:hypothetical protein
LADLRSNGSKHFRDIEVDESNILIWKALLVPVRFFMIEYHKLYM